MTRGTGRVLKRSLVFAIVLIAAALLLLPKLDFIRHEGGAGELLWKEGEAYLFIGNGTTGFRLSVFDYVIEPVKEYFYATASGASDSTSSFSIMRITPSGVQRYEGKVPMPLSRVTPLSDGIYASCLQGICKWTGTEFKAISKDEENKIGEASLLTNGDFCNVDGWSRRRIWSSLRREQIQPYNFSADLKNGTKLVVSGYNPVSIELLRSGYPSESVWYYKLETRRVSPSEYQQTFPQP